MLTFTPPVCLGSESNVTTIFSVEFSHEGFIWVTDYKDAGIKGLYLFLATFMGLYADGPAAAPVITLPLET